MTSSADDRPTGRRINGLDLRTRSAVAVVFFAALIAALAWSWTLLGEPARYFAIAITAFASGALLAVAARSLRSSVPPSDVTARREAGVQQQPSWTDFPDAMADPAIILDRASVIIEFNSAALVLFDRLRKDVTLEHVNRDPELIDAVARALTTGERRSARLVRRGERRLTATVAPLGGRRGAAPAAVLITIHDQSEQHRLLEMRSDFIANASHELRTPLASVRGFIETLQSTARNDPAARERFLSIMADQAERMTRLIDDLLLLSRVEEKANLKPTGKVDLGECLESVARSLDAAARERKITITVPANDATTVLPADPDELFQVFQNLIENAVKYGRDGGSVNVAIAREGGNAVISIADDGPGIAPEHLPRLTERFYRVSAEHSRRIGGTGLGLAIVKHVLNRHGAELRVESVVGRGTTFHVIIPGAQKI